MKSLFKRRSSSSSSSSRQPAPEPATDAAAATATTTATSLSALQLDPDIQAESGDARSTEDALNALVRQVGSSDGLARPFVPLNVIGRTHHKTPQTARILQQAGGLEALRVFTNSFYRKAFADVHIDQFIRSHDDPHGERFATWIAEKLGGEHEVVPGSGITTQTPWSDERTTRPRCPHAVGHGIIVEAHDRSSAHFAAWHSPKRAPEKFGEHFKLDDARVWMRLHFWAARESGMLSDPEFNDYYTRFIGHFVRVYEGTAPAFARESARWSLDQSNIDRYLAAGNRMIDVVGVPLRRAIKDLPVEEQRDASWPYGDDSY